MLVWTVSSVGIDGFGFRTHKIIFRAQFKKWWDYSSEQKGCDAESPLKERHSQLKKKKLQLHRTIWVNINILSSEKKERVMNTAQTHFRNVKK